MSLRNCGRFKSANHKEIGSANRKSAMCHICGKSANPTNYLSHKFADLQFGNLFADRPLLTRSRGVPNHVFLLQDQNYHLRSPLSNGGMD